MSGLGLSDAQVEQFIVDGFVRIDAAFPRAVADAARAILWRETGCDPHDPSTWARPVVRLGYHGQAPFTAAVNTPTLHRAFDQLVGHGRWRPGRDVGTFPIRFPSPAGPGDTGWHVDVSFGPDGTDYSQWRVNIASKGRALLMLFLLSDVSLHDAPTRIRAGSHIDIARLLAPAGEDGRRVRHARGGVSWVCLGDGDIGGGHASAGEWRRQTTPFRPITNCARNRAKLGT